MESNSTCFSAIASKRSEIELLLIDVVKDGIQKVAEYQTAGGTVARYTSWSEVDFARNGLPIITSHTLNVPNDYAELFSSYLGVGVRKIDVTELPPYTTYLDYIAKTPALRGRFFPNRQGKEDVTDIYKTVALADVYRLIDRYIHTVGSCEFQLEPAKKIIGDYLQYMTSEFLPIDIVVPILCIDFDFDYLEVSNNIEIRRLTIEEHQARLRATSTRVSVHNNVLSAATHALVFRNWTVKNKEWTFEFNILSNIQAYPIVDIDRFFASIRIMTEAPTGYAQIFSFAVSWISNPISMLPEVHGVTTRSYPAGFENYYWNTDPIPTISVSEMHGISRVFRALEKSNENALNLSTKRLNRCLIRESEEDSVLDATIALEALLASDGNQEMTHKLALRVGALVGVVGGLDKSPKQAFDDIKRIYKYRSAIVHGSHTLDNKRMISVGDNERVPAQLLAIDYLKFVLKALIEFPEYRNPKVIDQSLLLESSYPSKKENATEN